MNGGEIFQLGINAMLRGDEDPGNGDPGPGEPPPWVPGPPPWIGDDIADPEPGPP